MHPHPAKMVSVALKEWFLTNIAAMVWLSSHPAV
jgi:hypothetical protein